MRGRLQRFDYRRSSYHRVTQDWVCGHAAAGRPCQIGPDANGHCRADFECRPRQNEDGRWGCNRSEAAGGRCENGPLPDGSCCRAIPKCQPVRSLPAKRRAVSRWVMAVSIGLIALAMGSSAMKTAFSPGDLSAGHGLLNEDCSVCHTAFNDGPSGWIHAAFFQNNIEADNHLCLTCHNLGDTPNTAHSQPPSALRPTGLDSSQTSRKTLTLAMTRSLTGAHEEEEALACMSCHTEHKGRNMDISLMSNDQCQSCHESAFLSFSQGHPNFGSYPYLRRTGIAFDHVSHIKKHFQDEEFVAQAPTTCAHCHAPSIDGAAMVTSGFETSCAACHAGEIKGDARATSKGIAVLNVPGLDILTLAERGAPVGYWPEFAEELPTPFMDLLLASDARYFSAKAVLDQQVDPLDLTDADHEVIAAATELAWSVKDLMHDLVVEGLPALKSRLEAALGREISSEDMALLGALLPQDAVSASANAWFPELLDEVARYRAGEAVLFPAPAEEPAMAAEPDSALDEEDSGDMLDDDGLADGGDILGGEDVSEEDSLSLEGLDSDASDGDILGDDELADDGDILESDTDVDEASGEGEILSLETLDDAASDGEIIGTDDLSGADDILGEESEETDLFADSDEEESSPEAMAPVSGEDWASAGGWYQEEFVLRYRPSGHADGFLKSWIEQAAAAQVGGTLFGERLFELVADAKAPGACMKCHSIELESNSAPQVRWRAKQPTPHVRGFTRFSHAPHFSVLDERGCLTCHVLDIDAEYMEAFADHDPLTFAPNFESLDKSQCSECHVPHEAGDSCVMCHNYHVGTFPPLTVSTAGMAKETRPSESSQSE